jgi:hypothetical protein
MHRGLLHFDSEPNLILGFQSGGLCAYDGQKSGPPVPAKEILNFWLMAAPIPQNALFSQEWKWHLSPPQQFFGAGRPMFATLVNRILLHATIVLH